MEQKEVNAIRVWMRQVMDSKGWSANQWASLAGTSPTNITRFLKDAKYVPSSRTISKLAYVAGTSPTFSQVPIQQAEVNAVALYDDCRVRLGVISVFGVKGEIKGYKLGRNWPAHQMNGNDILIVRKSKSFKAGDIVVAFAGDNFLVLEASSENNKFISQSRIFSNKELKIEGVVVQIIRNLHD